LPKSLDKPYFQGLHDIRIDLVLCEIEVVLLSVESIKLLSIEYDSVIVEVLVNLMVFITLDDLSDLI
jgi:hypothetical protein